MKISAVALGLSLAALGAADRPKLPDPVCKAVGADGKPFKTINYGGIMCAATRATDVLPDPLKKAVPFSKDECRPAFCNSNTAVDICPNGPEAPDNFDLEWGQVMKQLESAFTFCGGTVRDDTHILPYAGNAYYVRSQAFQYIGRGYSLTVRGQNCDDGYQDVTVKTCLGKVMDVCEIQQ